VFTKFILRGGADKSLAFPIFLFAAQPKEFFLYGLKKLEQRSHKCVELGGGICRVNTFFFNPVVYCFLYKAKELSAPSYMCIYIYIYIYMIKLCGNRL
jgi:hypothetical protein